MGEKNEKIYFLFISDIVPQQKMCRVLPNNTIVCDPVLYEKIDAWRNHKDQIDNLIQQYRSTINDLKVSASHFLSCFVFQNKTNLLFLEFLSVFFSFCL